jgi:hypothetical protein
MAMHLKRLDTVVLTLMITLIIGAAYVRAPRSVHAQPQTAEQRAVAVKALRDAPASDHATAAIRDFGWGLLEGYVQPDKPDSVPGWEKKWKSKCSFSPTLSRFCPQTSLATTLQHSASRPRDMLSNVYYNDVAAEWITTKRVSDDNLLNTLMDHHMDSIPHPAPGAVVVKEIWEGFNLTNPPWAIAVYDSQKVQANDGTLSSVASWNNWATIDRVGSPGNYVPNPEACDDNAHYDAHKGVGLDQDHIPLACFVHRQSAGACRNLVQLKDVSPLPGRILDADQPCIIVLVGVQIATRLLDNWTWAAFWFTIRMNDLHTDGRHLDRLPPEFHHFAMDIQLPPDKLPPAPDALAAVYNPYLEGPMPNGVTSNCVSCHASAAYVPGCKTNLPGCMSDAVGFASRAPAKGGPTPPCSVDAQGHITGRCILTSFLWSVADAQDKTSQ